MAKKLYLYKLLSDLEHSPVYSKNFDGVFVSNHGRIIGLDRNTWRGNKMRIFEESNLLKQFEVRQNKFDLLIYNAEKIGIKLINIVFNNELLEDEHDMLLQNMRLNDENAILDFIQEQRFNWGNDVEEVTFIEKGMTLKDKISLSREGVLTINSNEESPQEVISKVPIGVLSGTYIPNFSEMEEREI